MRKASSRSSGGWSWWILGPLLRALASPNDDEKKASRSTSRHTDESHSNNQLATRNAHQDLPSDALQDVRSNAPYVRAFESAYQPLPSTRTIPIQAEIAGQCVSSECIHVVVFGARKHDRLVSLVSVHALLKMRPLKCPKLVKW